MKYRSIVIVLAVLFTAQSCTLLGGDETSGPRGVFASSDSGESWQEINQASAEEKSALAAGQVVEIFIDSENPNDILVATANRGLFASENRGEEWFPLLPEFTAFSVFIDPENNDEIYVAGALGEQAKILKSPNRGGVWVEIFSEPSKEAIVTAMTFDQNNPDIMYAGLSTGTIIKSTDRGETWNSLTDLKDRIVKLRVAPNDSNIVYALGRKDGLQESLDAGNSWSEVPVGRVRGRYEDLAIVPDNPSVMFVGTSAGLRKTTDRGANWSEQPLPISDETIGVTAIGINPDNTFQIYIGISSTMYRSDDGAVTFQTSKLETERVMNEIVFDPEEPNRIYVGFK